MSGTSRTRLADARLIAPTLVVLLLWAASMLAGCASTPAPKVESSAPQVTERLARPTRILVYDFAGTRADLPQDSVIRSHFDANEPAQTAADIEMGRQLGREAARRLVERLRGQGIEVYAASDRPTPQAGDVLIRGEFVAIRPGSRTMRVLIGFGAGRGELNTLIEAFQVTPDGPRTLAFATTQTAGGRMPGLLVPLGLAGAVGSLATSAAVSGSANVMQEQGPESLRAAAQRTADGVAGFIVDFYRQRGWLDPEAST